MPSALVRDEPLNVWSRIQLVIWDVPEDVQLWHLGQSLPGKPPVEVIAAVRALPGEWEEIAQQMQVLEEGVAALWSSPSRAHDVFIGRTSECFPLPGKFFCLLG